MTQKHWYKDAYVEEEVDDKGRVTSYKQWNKGELIIHRTWEYDEQNLFTFKDVLDGRISYERDYYTAANNIRS